MDADHPATGSILHACSQLSRDFGFHLADLNRLPLGQVHFLDPVHVMPAVSSVIGLGLLPELSTLLPAPRPSGGRIAQTPYRVLKAADLAGTGPLGHFENSLISLEHARIDRAVTLPVAPQETLIGLGYFRPFQMTDPTGIEIDGMSFQLADHGYFLEALPPLARGPIRLAPLNGARAGVQGLMGRGVPDKAQEFAAPLFVDALVWCPETPLESIPAERDPVKDLKLKLLSAALAGLDLPQVPPRALDMLCDMALALMRLARIGRPDGPLINARIKTWEEAAGTK